MLISILVMVLGEDGSIIDPEHELHRQLYEPMRECSRQRLRSLQMGLRKYANIDSRITVKELQQVFQVCIFIHYKSMPEVQNKITFTSVIFWVKSIR